MIVVALAAALLAGLSLLALLRVRTSTVAGMVGFAFFLGVIGLALWTHALLLVRIPVALPSLLAAPVLLAAAAAWKGNRSVLRASWGRPTIEAIPLALSFLLAVIVAFSLPVLATDGEVIYAFKARSILHHGTFWNPDFTDPASIHPASRRPLLLPCVFADFFMLTGGTDYRQLRLWLALVFIGSLGVLHERARPPLLWLAAFAWMPAFWRENEGVCAGFPDPTLGVLFLLGFDALRKGEKALAILSLSAAVLLKQDAWTFPVAIALATAFTLRKEAWPTARILLLPASLIVLWIVLSRRFPWSFDFFPGQFSPGNLLASPARWPHVLARLASELVKPKHWGVFWFLALLGIGLSIRRLTRDDARWLLVVLFQGAAYVLVWATYPKEEIRGWMGVQDVRLMVHLVPLLWMGLGLKWGTPFSLTADSRSP